MLRPFIERAGEEQFALVGEDNFIISVKEFYKFFEQKPRQNKLSKSIMRKFSQNPTWKNITKKRKRG